MTENLFERNTTRLSDLPSELPVDLDPTANDFAAAYLRRTALHGRDAPDENTDPATLASIGASLFQPSSYFDITGYMPDFRGGFEPSFLSNLQQGNYFSAAGQLAGVVPLAGSIRKIARATAGFRRLAKRTRIFDDTIRRAEGEVAQSDLLRRSPGVVSDELAGLFATKGLEEQMLAKIESGRAAGALNWYNTEPLRQVFLKELGPEEGEQAFRKYMKYVAATSAVSDVGTNARNASYFFGLDTREGRVPNVGDKMPYPFGHRRGGRNHQIFARKVFDDELDELTYQKLNSFFQNLIGNYAPVTVDRHALRLPAMLAQDRNFLEPAYREMLDSGRITMEKLVNIPAAWRAPTAGEYAALEQFYKGLARKAGLSPAEAQAAAWVGGADLTNVRDNGLLSFMQHFEDRLHLTADKWRIPAAEVLRRFVRGEINLAALDDPQNTAA